MRRMLPLLFALAATAVVITACAPEPASESSTQAPTEASSPSPTPSMTQPHLIVTIDGLEFVDGPDARTALFSDGVALLALMEDVTGEPGVLTEMQDPPGFETDLVSYEWDGLSVVTDEGGEGGFSRVVVDAAAVGDIPIASQEGLMIGSTRDEVIGAQGWDVWDEDQDGIADYLGVGEQEVPGTTSLTRPGKTGIQYLMFALADDVVTQINAPADDFSDL